jgi:hypothetical protein
LAAPGQKEIQHSAAHFISCACLLLQFKLGRHRRTTGKNWPTALTSESNAKTVGSAKRKLPASFNCQCSAQENVPLCSFLFWGFNCASNESTSLSSYSSRQTWKASHKDVSCGGNRSSRSSQANKTLSSTATTEQGPTSAGSISSILALNDDTSSNARRGLTE